MRLTDQPIIDALESGKSVIRQKDYSNPNCSIEIAILELKDGKYLFSGANGTYPFTIEDIKADDWIVLP